MRPELARNRRTTLERGRYGQAGRVDAKFIAESTAHFKRVRFIYAGFIEMLNSSACP
jgi:hypothetical protein